MTDAAPVLPLTLLDYIARHSEIRFKHGCYAAFAFR